MKIIRSFVKKLESRLKENLNFIQVIVGPRQVGKTTGLEQLIKKWTGPVKMVSADEMMFQPSGWLEMQWIAARAMGSGTLLVVDEVQKIPEWSSIVKMLYDADRRKRDLKVVLLGSASLQIQKGLSESLAGRYELIKVDHWSFTECEEAFGWSLNEYLKFGGYPAAAELVNDINRWQSFIRDSIIEPVLLKDLLSLSNVNKPALFRQTFLLCLAYPAMELSYQKLLGQLQEAGNVSTMKHYLEIFESAFLLKTLQKFSGSEVRKRGSSPKILPLNTALIHAIHPPQEIDDNPEWRGRVFECAVGAALLNQVDSLYYWRDGQYEVDFIAPFNGKIYAIEVKSSRIRKTGGLVKFIQRYPDAIPVIIDKKKGIKLLKGNTLPDLIG